MSLSFNGRAIADVRFSSVHGIKMAGGFGIRLSVMFNVQPWAEGGPTVCLAPAFVSIVGAEALGIGYAVPEVTIPFRVSSYPSEMGLLYDVVLSQGAMEAVERSRGGQGLVLTMRIQGTAWHEGKAEALQRVIDCRISQSDWIAALDHSGYGRTLLFEVPLPASSLANAPSPAKYLQRAKAHLVKGHYDEVVATCRLALESLSDGSDAADAQAQAMREFKGNPKALSLAQRELVLRQVAMNYTHLAHHHESDMELGRYDRSTATMVLGVTAALVSRAVVDASEL
jgi:hypothetical protein